MTKTSDVVEAPRKHPVKVLVIHIPILVFWVAFAVRDVADGSIKVKQRGQITPDTDPILFYWFATIIIGLAVALLIRILQAVFALADKSRV